MIYSKEESDRLKTIPCSIALGRFRRKRKSHKNFFTERAGDFWIFGVGSFNSRQRSLLITPDLHCSLAPFCGISSIEAVGW